MIAPTWLVRAEMSLNGRSLLCVLFLLSVSVAVEDPHRKDDTGTRMISTVMDPCQIPCNPSSFSSSSTSKALRCTISCLRLHRSQANHAQGEFTSIPTLPSWSDVTIRASYVTLDLSLIHDRLVAEISCQLGFICDVMVLLVPVNDVIQSGCNPSLAKHWVRLAPSQSHQTISGLRFDSHYTLNVLGLRTQSPEQVVFRTPSCGEPRECDVTICDAKPSSDWPFEGVPSPRPISSTSDSTLELSLRVANGRIDVIMTLDETGDVIVRWGRLGCDVTNTYSQCLLPPTHSHQHLVGFRSKGSHTLTGLTFHSRYWVEVLRADGQVLKPAFQFFTPTCLETDDSLTRCLQQETESLEGSGNPEQTYVIVIQDAGARGEGDLMVRIISLSACFTLVIMAAIFIASLHSEP